MKTTARFDATSTVIHAENDDDWEAAYDWPKGRKPVLRCPDCDVRLSAKRHLNKTARTETRWFAFQGSGRCNHRPTKKGVTVATGETAEHRWIKAWVARVAVSCGYSDVVVERRINKGNVVADVFVPGAYRSRVEVQRVPTDVADRTARFRDVLWLLRLTETADQSLTAALFEYPCVRLAFEQRREPGWTPVRPWEGITNFDARVKATCLTPAGDGGDTFFRPQTMSAEQFLREVWSGERRWYPRGRLHSYAGWVNQRDLDAYQAWRTERAASAIAANAMMVGDQHSENILGESVPEEANDSAARESGASLTCDSESLTEPIPVVAMTSTVVIPNSYDRENNIPPKRAGWWRRLISWLN